MYVQRENGVIIAAYGVAQPGVADEFLEGGNPELVEFLANPSGAFDVPAPVSDRQFAQGLAGLGLISENEAEEWVASGALPTAIVALVNALPEADRFPARMLLRGATSFEFAHPLAESFAQLLDPPWSTEQRAAFWRQCAAL